MTALTFYPPRIALLVFLGASMLPATASWGQSPSGFDAARQKMVDEEIVAAGVKNPRVIEAMREHAAARVRAAQSSAKTPITTWRLPIGEGQTISPPFVVAYMTEQLDPQPTDRVLEIGTGSGYQAAVLSPLVKDVYTIEIVETLGDTAAQTLKRLKYDNVHTKIGDGYQGWPENAPFDKIIVTCSPEKVPQPLVDQLRKGDGWSCPSANAISRRSTCSKKRDGKIKSRPCCRRCSCR